MKIRKAPVADLLDYLEELYNEKKHHNFNNILQVINRYYSTLSNHKNIMPINDAVLEDWCDLNFSDTMKNCPNVPGILIYQTAPNGARKYGLLYHSGYIYNRQTDFLSYYDIGQFGKVCSHTYYQPDWEGWGAPTRFFKFPEEDYIDSNEWTLGERPLELNCMGHDVRQLQQFLKKAHENVEVSGHFDEKTEKAVKDTQIWTNQSPTGKFELENGGQKIVDFLTSGRKPLLP